MTTLPIWFTRPPPKHLLRRIKEPIRERMTVLTRILSSLLLRPFGLLTLRYCTTDGWKCAGEEFIERRRSSCNKQVGGRRVTSKPTLCNCQDPNGGFKTYGYAQVTNSHNLQEHERSWYMQFKASLSFVVLCRVGFSRESLCGKFSF